MTSVTGPKLCASPKLNATNARRLVPRQNDRFDFDEVLDPYIYAVSSDCLHNRSHFHSTPKIFVDVNDAS
jgi:hypothetical protein